MKSNSSISKVPKVITASASTKKMIDAAAQNIKGKELFSNKIERAKRSLSDVTSLPI